eukprot:EG_transcript_26676
MGKAVSKVFRCIGTVLRKVLTPLKIFVDGLCAFADWCQQLNHRVQEDRTAPEIAHAEQYNPQFQALSQPEQKAAAGFRHGSNIQDEAVRNLTPEQQQRVRDLQW